jgi:uncharacterized delta-60 repeat protein
MKINLKQVFLILFFLFITFSLKAQVNQEWTARFNGLLDSVDVAVDLVSDPQGNVYVTGYTFSLLSGFDYLTIKYSSAGEELWTKTYNGAGNLTDKATAIAIDSKGYIYVTGFSFGGILPGFNYTTIKYSPAGDEVWTMSYNGPGNDEDKAMAVAVDNSDNVIVTGYSKNSSLPGSEDYLTIKYSSSGQELWTARYNGPGNNTDISYAVVIDDSDNIIITGGSRATSLPDSEDYATVKYSPSGQELWTARYNGPGNSTDIAYAVIIDDSDNIIVTGESRDTALPGSEDYATVKYSPSGKELWVSRYNGPGNSTDKSYAVVIDDSDNIIVTGESRSTLSPGSEDYATVKYSPSGQQQWAARYNGPGNSADRSYSAAVDSKNNIVVTGESRSGILPGSEDYATIKYSPEGEEIWTARYDGTGNFSDKSYAVIIDDSDNALVTGSSSSAGLPGKEDYLTIKYSDVVNIKIISTALPEKFLLSQNYPNPFNPSTKINFSLPLPGFVNISVYDINGNLVSGLVSEYFNAGTYEVEWEAGSFLPSGIYFYRLRASSGSNIFNESKKMLLIK